MMPTHSYWHSGACGVDGRRFDEGHARPHKPLWLIAWLGLCETLQIKIEVQRLGSRQQKRTAKAATVPAFQLAGQCNHYLSLRPVRIDLSSEEGNETRSPIE
jgi:hypothetical protein